MAKRDVKLNISTRDRGNGWEAVVASDGADYWYKFTGGNGSNNNGDDDFDTDNNAKSFDVSFKGPDEDNYDFLAFYKDAATDPDDQLSGVVRDDKKKVIVTDQCTQPTSGMIYGVTVQPVNTVATFNCHPVISNRPRFD